MSCYISDQSALFIGKIRQIKVAEKHRKKETNWFENFSTSPWIIKSSLSSMVFEFVSQAMRLSCQIRRCRNAHKRKEFVTLVKLVTASQYKTFFWSNSLPLKNIGGEAKDEKARECLEAIDFADVNCSQKIKRKKSEEIVFK